MTREHLTSAATGRKFLLQAILCLQLITVFFVQQGRCDEVYDPIEDVNRGIFWFNDQLYTYILRPVAQGYDAVTPNGVQRGIHNFFSNLRTPIYLVSDLAQLKFEQFGVHSARFVINSTIGVAGLFDVAKEWDMVEHQEDFGTALGYYGVEPGPYIVLPFLGPSNVRDAFGRVVDSFLSPTYWVTQSDMDSGTKTAIVVGAKTVETIDDTNRAREAIDLAKESSLDFYLFIRSAYNQRRLNLIYDNNPPKEAGAVEDASEPNFDTDDNSSVPLIGQ